MVIYENLDDFLKKYPNKTVFFAVANGGMIKLTRNFVRSCLEVGEKLVLFSVDRKITKKLSPYCDIVKYYTNLGGSKAYDYESKKFVEIAWYRYFILNEILKSGRTIIYSDIDIVVNNPITEYISKELEKTDCVCQTNGKNCCTGFFAIKPTKNTIDFFTKKNMNNRNYLTYLDQDFFNNFVFYRKTFDVKLLNINHFPNGKYFYKYPEYLNKVSYLIHFNNLIGFKNRIQKMKEHGKWAKLK